MDMNNVILAVVVLGVLGAVFGLILAFASKIFAVETDERLDPILDCLPGANCGGCGFSGCSAFANAIIAGKAQPGDCPVCSADNVAKIAGIMGVEAGSAERSIAMVKCSGGERAHKKFQYQGIEDCSAALKVGGNGPLDCSYGCLGMGSCVKACPFDAIHIKDGVAVVDHEACVACMKCATACPRNLIIKVPYHADINIACASKDKGGVLRKLCDIGCIGCKLCEKACEYDAIHVEDNLAYIDYEKCTSCGACVDKCPRHLIVDSRLKDEITPPPPGTQDPGKDAGTPVAPVTAHPAGPAAETVAAPEAPASDAEAK